jgi:glycosyltransferase involved in cell wall biosynthesis
MKSVPSCAARLRVLPHQIASEAWQPGSLSERAAAREAIKFAGNAFVVFTSFAMSSTLLRKNPLDAIASFQKAFPNAAGNEVLLIRCLDADCYPPGRAALLHEAQRDTRVRLVLKSSEAPPLLTCYHAADVYLTLHRGEGYGLNIDEALATETPVVATAYSLNETFLRHRLFHGVGSRLAPVFDPQHVYDSVPGARWPVPDIEEAAAALRRIKANRLMAAQSRNEVGAQSPTPPPQ